VQLDRLTHISVGTNVAVNVHGFTEVVVADNGDRNGSATSEFWYSRPAEEWTSALPVGNGTLGALVFGGTGDEMIALNESSIWCGPPVPQDRSNGAELVDEMRRLLFAGDPLAAEQLSESAFLVPDPSEDRAYQPLGFLQIRTRTTEPITDYRRELDLEDGVARVRFSAGETTYRREVLASFPDRLIAVNLLVEGGEALDVDLLLSRPGTATVGVHEAELHLTGQARAESGEYPGTRFHAVVRVHATDGRLERVDGGLRLRDAREATLVITAATDYDRSTPQQALTHDLRAECRAQLDLLVGHSYSSLRARHVADYQRLFHRSSLRVAVASNAQLPLDVRIAAAAAGEADPALLLLYYTYCRYLLISASRPGGLPMNLQGIWNPLMTPPWRSDWHLNINLQEAYWFAEQGNLAECHEPLFTFLEHLVEPARNTAAQMLGVKRGFFAGVRTDGTLFTALSQEPTWGMYVAGGAWCAQHLMEHFRFTQDKEFLKHRAFSLLRLVAQFWLEWLVPDPATQRLVSGPTASPENRFLLPDGRSASLSMGPSHDQEIAWNSLRDFLEASEILGIDDADTAAAAAALKRLALPEIGPDGRLQEWATPYDEIEPGHRHLSHLWGMMPGDRITPARTPEFVEAVRASLDYRLSHDYNAQGWSLGWAAALLARLGEGDRALELLSSEYFRHAWPNMFVEAHGHAQVGDMMGAPLALIELLVQSHAGEIELLPALPQAWESGEVEGLCARGGFVLDISWRNHVLSTATIRSVSGESCSVRYGDHVLRLSLTPGEQLSLSEQDFPL